MEILGIIMLKKSSLQRKKFNQEELNPVKKLDLTDITVAMPENLAQLLIWTSKLAQHNHAMFIQVNNELELVEENDQSKKRELNEKINFYRKNAIIENQTKDFYLKKLLDQGDVVVKGYIQHPEKEQIQYAVISYHGYDFVTLATADIIAKFPIHFIDFKKEKLPTTLVEIHANEDELLSAVRGLVKPFRKQFKEWVKKNKLIREHNAVVHEIYIKIKNGSAELIKDTVEEVKKEVLPKEKTAVPKVEETAPIQAVNSNEKPITVVKKRKFALVKDK